MAEIIVISGECDKVERVRFPGQVEVHARAVVVGLLDFPDCFFDALHFRVHIDYSGASVVCHGENSGLIVPCVDACGHVFDLCTGVGAGSGTLPVKPCVDVAEYSLELLPAGGDYIQYPGGALGIVLRTRLCYHLYLTDG